MSLQFSISKLPMSVSFFPAILLLHCLVTAAPTTATGIAHSPVPPPFTRRPHPHTPRPPPPQQQRRPFVLQDNKNNQLVNVIDALIGSGDFAGWINLFSTTDPSSLPLTATLFIPSNDAVSHFPSASASGIPFDPLLVPYHIVPQRLTLADLRRLPTHTRLPTLLSSKYIIITNNSASNFTVDESLITMPDIFENTAFSVHGIDKVLDYSIYGNADGLKLPPVAKKMAPRPPPTWPEETLPQPSKGIAGMGMGIWSGTPALVCSESLMSILSLFLVFWY